MLATATTNYQPTSQRVTLENISWHTYETILTEIGNNRHIRLAYDQGKLEIMTPLMPHEYNNRLLEHLVFTLAEELNLNLKSTGSITCKREGIIKGVEPDSSFYIQNEPLVRSKENLDFNQDPPPDLVIEVDYTSASIDRMPIYLALGVPEVWRYNQNIMEIYQLREGVYIPCDVSPTFANLPLTTEIPRFLAESLQIGEIPMIRAFRTWLRQQKEK
jgi:Uma2 family endonuclease